MVVYSKGERNIYHIFTSPGTTVQCELLGWTQTRKEGHSIYNYAKMQFKEASLPRLNSQKCDPSLKLRH